LTLELDRLAAEAAATDSINTAAARRTLALTI